MIMVRARFIASASALALLVALLALTSRADDGGVGASESSGDTITVGDPCDALEPYEPAPDVAYKPGVDVDGNAVAPADVPGSDSLIGPDHEYKIPLEVPLDQATDTSSGSGVEAVAGSDIQVGELTVVGNDVTFNGQPVDPNAHALSEACARRQSEGQD